MADGTESLSSRLAPPEESATAVFVSWERLRLLYNVVLASLVLGLANHSLANGEFLRFLVLAGLGANVCFCAGPVAEGYLALLGAHRPTCRWVVFLFGLFLASLLTVVTLFAWHAKVFD